jgi:O-antigen/teichoic acid export membrane protein
MLQKLKEKTVRLLRWSEQYTKTDMVYLAKGSFWTWLGKGTALLTGIAVAIAFANLLPKETYGNYKYILSVAGILGTFTLSGMIRAITRSVAQGYEGSLKKGVKVVSKWSSFILIAALIVSGYYFWQGNALLGGGMLIVALLQPIVQSTEVYKAQLLGKKLFKIQGIYLTLQEVTQAGLIIAALFFTSNALVLIAILFITNALFGVIYLWQTTKKYIENKKVDAGTIPYAKHLSVIRILETGAKHLDKVLIFQMLGAAPTAIYSFALLPTDKLDSFFRSIGNIVLPKFSDTPFKKLQKTVTRKVLIAFAASIVISVSLILALPTIFNLVFPAYMDSVIYAQWLAVSLIFIPEFLFTYILIAHKKTKAMYGINVSSDVLRIVLLAILLSIYGIWGAIYTLLIYLSYRTMVKMIYFYSR